MATAFCPRKRYICLFFWCFSFFFFLARWQWRRSFVQGSGWCLCNIRYMCVYSCVFVYGSVYVCVYLCICVIFGVCVCIVVYVCCPRKYQWLLSIRCVCVYICVFVCARVRVSLSLTLSLFLPPSLSLSLCECVRVFVRASAHTHTDTDTDTYAHTHTHTDKTQKKHCRDSQSVPHTHSIENTFYREHIL
jgi:hypothetical protein